MTTENQLQSITTSIVYKDDQPCVREVLIVGLITMTVERNLSTLNAYITELTEWRDRLVGLRNLK